MHGSRRRVVRRSIRRAAPPSARPYLTHLVCEAYSRSAAARAGCAERDNQGNEDKDGANGPSKLETTYQCTGSLTRQRGRVLRGHGCQDRQPKGTADLLRGFDEAGNRARGLLRRLGHGECHRGAENDTSANREHQGAGENVNCVHAIDGHSDQQGHADEDRCEPRRTRNPNSTDLGERFQRRDTDSHSYRQQSDPRLRR
jgi:hypothetical protein